MASVTYSGSFGGVSGSNGLTTTLNRTAGSVIPSTATITSVQYSLRIKAGGYSSSDYWNLSQIAVGGQGGRPSATADAGMQSSEHTFSGNMSFSASGDVGKFSGDSITVYAAAYTTHSSTSYLWEVSITVNYELYSACGAPTACTVSSTLATGNVTLSWSGAKAGTGNAITGYEVQRCESSNGSTWGSWSTLQTVSSTATSDSLSVAPPTTAGNYYKYRVRTLGAAGASYYSGWKESTNTLRRNWTACGAPTACTVSSTLATGNVTLSWSGASAGYGNAITSYEVQRCESSNGSTWGSWSTLKTVSSTATSGSLEVAPPTTAGNYYKYRVRTQGAAGSSYYSGYKESTNTLRRDHAPLAGFTDATLTTGTTPIKAVHMQELQDRVNELRTFYGLSVFSFTNIVAGKTSLAGWTTHVQEIRTAIDGIGKTHETWLKITENKPRADVVQQLRNVVLSL